MCSAALRPRRVSPAVFARQTCVGLDARDAPTSRDDSSVTAQLAFLWAINTQRFKKEPLWPGLGRARREVGGTHSPPAAPQTSLHKRREDFRIQTVISLPAAM